MEAMRGARREEGVELPCPVPALPVLTSPEALQTCSSRLLWKLRHVGTID